jgi:putative restriction endonuclease
MARHFGHVEGEDAGRTYQDRREAFDKGVHRQLQAGISGTPAEGASSIVLNGGYPDDEDEGNLIIYTGHGGQKNRKQVEDQRLDDSGNAALVRSELDGLPVRVIRGYKGDPAHSPTSGYRYDGLYRVVDHWPKTRPDGFLVWQFRLEKMPDDVGFTVADPTAAPPGNHRPGRRSATVQRTVRTTAVAEWVKRRHEHTCQVCGLSLKTYSGDGYAEGAHIRPLGRPHSGPDVAENILCLCPNHHVLLDKGGITIDDDSTVRDRAENTIATLRKVHGHDIDPRHLQYHRDNWAAV